MFVLTGFDIRLLQLHSSLAERAQQLLQLVSQNANANCKILFYHHYIRVRYVSRCWRFSASEQDFTVSVLLVKCVERLTSFKRETIHTRVFGGSVWRKCLAEVLWMVISFSFCRCVWWKRFCRSVWGKRLAEVIVYVFLSIRAFKGVLFLCAIVIVILHPYILASMLRQRTLAAA